MSAGLGLKLSCPAPQPWFSPPWLMSQEEQQGQAHIAQAGWRRHFLPPLPGQRKGMVHTRVIKHGEFHSTAVSRTRGLKLDQTLVRSLPQLSVFSETLANFLIFPYFHFFIGKMRTPAGLQEHLQNTVSMPNPERFTVKNTGRSCLLGTSS